MKLYSDTFGHGTEVTAYWFPTGQLPSFITLPNEYDIVLVGPCINLITLIYECEKAVRFLRIQNAIEDGVDEPYQALYAVGVMVEEIAAELQRQGFYWGCKIAPGSVFNRAQLLALHAPGTPDVVEALLTD